LDDEKAQFEQAKQLMERELQRERSKSALKVDEQGSSPGHGSIYSSRSVKSNGLMFPKLNTGRSILSDNTPMM
jgi:hypothetical protein